MRFSLRGFAHSIINQNFLNRSFLHSSHKRLKYAYQHTGKFDYAADVDRH